MLLDVETKWPNDWNHDVITVETKWYRVFWSNENEWVILTNSTANLIDVHCQMTKIEKNFRKKNSTFFIRISLKRKQEKIFINGDDILFSLLHLIIVQDNAFHIFFQHILQWFPKSFDSLLQLLFDRSTLMSSIVAMCVSASRCNFPRACWIIGQRCVPFF